MGVAPSFVPFFDRVHARSALRGPALGLGTLDLNGDLAAFGHPELCAAGGRRAVGSLLRLRYGIDSYLDADINGLADLFLDLGAPLPDPQRGRYPLILNAGTIEHVFDLRQAFECVHDLLAPSGVVIHIAPLSFMEHAFVNLSAKVFRDVAAANRYETIAEAIWRPATAAELDADPRRDAVLHLGPDFAHPGDPTLRLGPEELRRSPMLPANLLYLGAFAKSSGAAGGRRFTSAIDVGT